LLLEHSAKQKLTKKAGYDPTSGAEALRKLNRGFLTHGTFLQSLTSTHPSIASRAEDIREKAERGKK